MVDEHYINQLLLRVERESAKPVPPDNVIYVTELASPCARRVWYSRRYEPEATESEAIKWLGKALHEVLEKGLRSDGWEVEVPVAINDTEVRIVGRVDAAMVDYLTDEYTDIIEIKTVDLLPRQPRIEHVRQAAIYAAILKAKKYHIVYISRRDGRVKVYSGKVKGHDNILEDAKAHARKLKQLINSNTPPKPKHGPWCSYCPYRWKCWGSK